MTDGEKKSSKQMILTTVGMDSIKEKESKQIHTSGKLSLKMLMVKNTPNTDTSILFSKKAKILTQKMP
jgi:hypothetical protein